MTMNKYSLVFLHYLISVVICPLSVVYGDIFSNIPEATSEGYVLVYELDIPDTASFHGATPIPYSTDNSGSMPPFDRIGYYIELDTGSGLKYVYASMDTFTMDASEIGLPHDIDNPVLRQEIVNNMNVVSNASGITNANGIAAGSIEMWPSDYSTTNTASIPGASDATYDFGDGGATTNMGYGSFQIHNHGAGEVLFAYNRWGYDGSGVSNLGIGTAPSGQPDWTFIQNADTYSVVKKLQIVVRPSGSGLLTFTDKPKDMQLYPRNLITNQAVVNIVGEEILGGFDEIILRAYRDGIQQGADSVQALAYSGGKAPFSFTPTIVAELSLYDFKLFTKQGGSEALAWSADDVVAGDALLIAGQSNANSYKNHNGSANANQGIFLRSFGMNSSISAANVNWYQAEGDAYIDSGVGNIGQWPIRMGRLLIDSYNIPLVIINGAHGGQPIGFFQRNDANHTDLITNYGRLLTRVQNAGLENNIRSILWYQGESDWDDGAGHEAGFTELYNDWNDDYPGVEKFYVHQLRVGCGVAKNNVDLRDRQRRMPETFANLEAMSTTGIDGHDGCHYYYTNGYEVIGQHIFNLVARDLYAAPPAINIEAPNIGSARFTDANKDSVIISMENFVDTLVWDVGAEIDFILEGTAITVSSGSASGNEVTLILSGNAGAATGISYTGHTGAGAWVTNLNGVGMFTFYDVPILDAAAADLEQLSILSANWGTPYSLDDLMTLSIAWLTAPWIAPSTD